MDGLIGVNVVAICNGENCAQYLEVTREFLDLTDPEIREELLSADVKRMVAERFGRGAKFTWSWKFTPIQRLEPYTNLY